MGPQVNSLSSLEIANVRFALASRLRFHVRAQNGVDAGLVAAAALLQPFDHIMIDPNCEPVFGLGHCEPRGLPE